MTWTILVLLYSSDRLIIAIVVVAITGVPGIIATTDRVPLL